MCPEYNVSSISSTGQHVSATLKLHLPDVQYGEVSKLTLEIFSTKDQTNSLNSHTWDVAGIKQAQDKATAAGGRTVLTHTAKELPLNTIFRPTISWTETFRLETPKDSGNYDQKSESKDSSCSNELREFTSKEWACDKSEGHTIPMSNVCNGKEDCGNGEDEDEKLCLGVFLDWVIIGVASYVFVGFFAYVGTRAFGSKRPDTDEQPAIRMNNMEENIYDTIEENLEPEPDQEKKDLAEHFSSPMVKIFTTRRTFDDNNLSEDEAAVVKEHYLELKRNKKIHYAYEHLRTSADAPTIESVMKFLLKVERQDNQYMNDEPVYLYIMENIPQGNGHLPLDLFVSTFVKCDLMTLLHVLQISLN